MPFAQEEVFFVRHRQYRARRSARRVFVTLLSVATLMLTEITCTGRGGRKLTQPTEIQGVLCKEYAVLYENGRLKQTILARQDTFTGQCLPAGTRITLTLQGALDWCELPTDMQIQGILCKGEGVGGWQMAFYPNGKLKLAWLAHDQEIQGFPCMEASYGADVGGGDVGIHFHDNGNLARCKLAKVFTVAGHKFNKGEHVNLDREGKLVEPK
jgi:hypothetical protein